MMGYGPYGGSYSSSSSPSSSSNLSPLAPPFMIDRSFTKHSSTPLLDLTEPSLSYAAPLSSSPHNWLPSAKPNSGTLLFPNQKLESCYVPSSNAFRYRGIQKMELSNTQLPPLNSFPSTSADVLAFGQCSDSVAANLVEAQPYYPSYLPCATDNSSPLLIPDQTSYDSSSTSHVPSMGGSSLKDFTQRSSTSKNSAPWDGLWNELGDSELEKQREFEGTFFSMETVLPVSFYNNYMDQGTQPKDLSTCCVASLGIDTLDLVRNGGLIQPEKLDDQSFLRENPNFIPVDDAKPVFGYGKLKTSFSNCKMSTENLIEESFMRQNPNFMPAEKVRCNFRVEGIDTFSSNGQLPNNASYEKHLRKHDVSLNDGTTISKPSPAVVIKPPATVTSSLVVHADSVKASNFGSGATTPYTCSNNSSSKIESHNSPPNPEGKLSFDPGQLRTQLEKNSPILSEALLTKNEDVLNNWGVNNGALDNWSKDKCGRAISSLDQDDFNLDLKANRMTNSVESLPETVDSCNLNVDSPCWKGVPLASPWQEFEFEALIPQQMKKQEECNSLNVPEKELFPAGTGYAASSLKSSENTMHPKFGCLENGLHMNICSSARLTFGEQKSADTAKGNCHLECDEGVQHSNNTREIIESGFKSSFKVSQIPQQSLRREGLTSDVANDASEYFSSQMPSSVIDHFMCSSNEDGSTKHKSSNQQSIPTIDVLMLVNAMHSISDVLLFHCVNGLCQLKEKDLRAIKSVISNLNMCMSKIAEKVVAELETNYSFNKTSDFLAERNDLHKPTKTTYPSTPDEHCMSSKEDNKLSKSSSMGGDPPGILEDDKMVKALKKVLRENFKDDEETQPQTLMYKNLWLDAEAALCAVNCKARFNRMKMDMSKCKSEDMRKGTAESLGPYASTEPDKVHVMSPSAKDFPNSKVENSSILSTSSQGDDVLARFRILECQIDNLSTATADDPTSSKISPDPNEANKELDRSREGNCSTKPDICNQDSTVTYTNNHTNDFEASVKARLHILKLRDICSSVSKENPPSGNIGFGCASKRNDWSVIGPRLEDRNSCEKTGHSLQHHTAYNECNITMKGFHLFDDEDQLVQPPRRNRSENQLCAGQRDSLSSDWEHVMDEECRAHNH